MQEGRLLVSFPIFVGLHYFASRTNRRAAASAGAHADARRRFRPHRRGAGSPEQSARPGSASRPSSAASDPSAGTDSKRSAQKLVKIAVLLRNQGGQRRRSCISREAGRARAGALGGLRWQPTTRRLRCAVRPTPCSCARVRLAVQSKRDVDRGSGARRNPRVAGRWFFWTRWSTFLAHGSSYKPHLALGKFERP